MLAGNILETSNISLSWSELLLFERIARECFFSFVPAIDKCKAHSRLRETQPYVLEHLHKRETRERQEEGTSSQSSR